MRLADTAVDFLRLVAVGYREFTAFDFGAEPESFGDDQDPVDAHAGFRAWVETTFRVSVPPLWDVEADPEFDAWIGALAAERGRGIDRA